MSWMLTHAGKPTTPGSIEFQGTPIGDRRWMTPSVAMELSKLLSAILEGLPVNHASKSYTQEDLICCLNLIDLDYEQVEHEPVYTIEDALAATPRLDGIKTKNVFLRDAKGLRHFLVIVPHDRRLDLSKLSLALSVSKLSMGSPERLSRYLGVTPGAVSVFALINDHEKAVELIVDEEVWKASKLQGHPLQNTATVAITHSSLESFLSHTGHKPRVFQVP